MILGTREDGHQLKIDLGRLVETRLIVQANSGGGKSWAIRRILEQTNGKIQQLVLDVEDEFHTLRERYDYVLAGGTGGDCPADVRSARLLARRLLELGVSAIIGIFELKAHDRIRFVREFLDALVNAPRDLWHPALVVVDEAHMFAPQHGEAESAGAVIDLMTRGRKRGFCGILATQRISKLHKDAAAEANNKLIGRSALDVDMKRAADELGFSGREDQLALRTLKPGEFFCFGPAIADRVEKIKVGPIETMHPRAGEHSAPPPPPRDKVKRLLDQLKDLPKEAAAEAQTVADLKARIRELERAPRGTPADPAALERARAEGRAAALREAQAVEKDLRKALAAQEDKLRRVAAILGVAAPQIPPVQAGSDGAAAPRGPSAQPATIPRVPRAAPADGSADRLPPGERAVLEACIQYPDGLAREQLTVLTGYKRSSRDAYIARLSQKGLVEITAGNRIRATEEGAAALPDVRPLPTGDELRDFWFGKLPPGEKAMLERLLDAFPEAIERDELSESTGYKRSSRDAYLKRLAAKQLVEDAGRGAVRATETIGAGVR